MTFKVHRKGYMELSKGNLESQLVVRRYAAAVGMCIYASKTKMLLATIPEEQHHAGLLDSEPLEDFDSFNCLGAMFLARAPTTSAAGKIVRSAFSRLQSCLWSPREPLLCTKGRIYQTVMRSILLYGCETWPVRIADERVFDNDNIHRILCVRRRDCVPSVGLRRRLALQVYWHCSCKRDPASLVTLQDVPTLKLLTTTF